MKIIILVILLGFVGLLGIAVAGDLVQQEVVHLNEDVTWSVTTIVLCALGWALHWLAGWMELWKQRRASLLDNILENKPAFIFSVCSTIAVYMIGPGAIASFGIDLSAIPPQTAGTLAKIGALSAGYMSDSIVAKIASLVRKP